jgi:hypothetical protein
MVSISKQLAFIILTGILSFLLFGCQLFNQTDISLTTNITSGHPTIEHEGLPVIFSIQGLPTDSNAAYLNFDDGETIRVSNGKLTHVYRTQGEYNATLQYKNKLAQVTIRAINNPPRVTQPWGITNYYEWHEYIIFDMTHCYKGCMPQFEYGAHDPDGDPLTYQWSLVEDNGRIDTVFGPTQEVITNKEGPYVKAAIFMGSDTITPLFPFTPFAIKNQLSPHDPNATLKCIVRDYAGGETVYEKRIYIEQSSCSG